MALNEIASCHNSDRPNDIGTPKKNRIRRRFVGWFLKYHPRLVMFTFGAILVLFVFSVYVSFTAFTGATLSSPGEPFFYIFLYVVNIPVTFSLSEFLIAMFILYAMFFSYMLYGSMKENDYASFKSPIGYFILVSSASLLISLLIVEIEAVLGIPIGGSSLTTLLQQYPLQSYASLIYAPFVEELGFRIIPLGLFSAILVSLKMRRESGKLNIVLFLKAIVMPGPTRSQLKIQTGKIDWLLILATSALFGYAHIYFGAWDWGKFVETFVFGIIVAISFLKFGAYMDIPMHWFTNGLLGIIYIDATLTLAIGFLFVWLLFIGILGLILIAKLLLKRTDKQQTS